MYKGYFKGILILLFLSIAGIVFSQNVGISLSGASPNSSAILDLNTGSSGNRGFLPPKVALTATNSTSPITSPATGLIVYDTVSAGTAPNNVTEGYYYYNGSSWIRLLDNNTVAPYGYNTQYDTATANMETASDNSFVQVMSITFTPVHSTVYLSFSASGMTTNTHASNIQWAMFQVVKDPSGSNTLLQGTVTLASHGNNVSAWNAAINLPVSVTAGTSITIALEWETNGSDSGGWNDIQTEAVTDPDYSHMSMFIND